MKATRTDAYNLFHRGTLALAQVEHNGIKVDTDYLKKTRHKVQKQLRQLGEELKQDPVWVTWQKTYGDKANLTSRPQLAHVLFNVLGHPCTQWTEGGKGTEKEKKAKRKPSTDEGHLKTVKIPFVTKYLEKAKLEKVDGTYLSGIEREVDCNGFLHPVFSLAGGGGNDDDRGGAKSGRSSCQLPNFQNMPIRSKVQGELIRRCFIPRDGHLILEVDYAQLEGKIIACHWIDDKLVDYFSTPGRDIHRDTASECYALDFTGWDKKHYKDMRYCAKNKFVFPEFYGSVYVNCSAALWDAIDSMKLTLPDGKSVKTHLEEKGIKSLGQCSFSNKPKPGTYEHYIWSVERNFWEKKFPKCAEARDKWVRSYRKNGYLDYLTGFRVEGILSRRQVFNWPVQGAAFHCLLWSLITLQNYLITNKCQSKIVGEIHDSIILDVHPSELDDLLYVIKKIMTRSIRKAWPWIIVPLEIEADCSPIDGSWHEKSPIKV